MRKLLMTIAAAGIGFGLNTAIVGSAHAAQTPKSWSDFKIMVRKCDTLTGADKKQCMADARDTYRASNYNCERMSGADQTQCVKYREQWKTAAAGDTSSTNAPITHTEEPTMTPASPGDPSPSERNRDSTKQQEDAAGNLPKKD